LKFLNINSKTGTTATSRSINQSTSSVESGLPSVNKRNVEKPRVQINSGNPNWFPSENRAPGAKQKCRMNKKCSPKHTKSKMKSHPKTALSKENVKRFIYEMDNEFREKMIDLASQARFDLTKTNYLLRRISVKNR
jgi:hypothetical protein